MSFSMQAAAQARILYAGGYLDGLEGKSPAIWEGSVLRIMPVGPEDQRGRVTALCGGDSLAAAGITWKESAAPHPALWIEGELTRLPLPDGSPAAWATALARDGGAYVVSGFTMEKDGSSRPLYWRSGIPSVLPIEAGMTSGKASGICVEKGSVWIAGRQWNAKGYIGGFWKDGAWTRISSADSESDGLDSVSGTAGTLLFGGTAATDYGDTAVMYFLGHSGKLEEYILESSEDTFAELGSVLVEGPNIWVAGALMGDDDSDTPAYWRNGHERALTMPSDFDSGFATCLTAAPDGTVMAAGYLGHRDDYIASEPVVWTGLGEAPTSLTTAPAGDGSVQALAWAPAGR
jgi:hypothetical protein